MRTGRTFPCLSCVLALNCLQNSMMLIPLEPSAGPIGGAGLACPPLHWSLTKPVTSFAIFYFFGVSVALLAPLPITIPKLRTKELFWEGKGREIIYNLIIDNGEF